MLINSKVIEVIFAVFILANNFYTTYNIIYTDCKSVIYNVAILSIVNNMITFVLVTNSKCCLSYIQPKMVATIQKCISHF